MGKRLKPGLITFDFGDTLVSSVPAYLDRIALVLGELKHPRTAPEVTAAYFKADLAAATELLPRVPFTPDQFREVFGRNFFRELGLLDHAADVAGPLTQALLELKPRRVMVPGAGELLRRLREGGYRLGIISNNDGRTREKCQAVGIADDFLFILDSTLEGIMKPDPRIFHKAGLLAGVSPGEMLHVGDLWGCDILGARAAGVPAAWLVNQVLAPPPLADAWRIARLLDLLELIEL